MNDLKKRAKQLKTDIPAVFLALKDKETPIAAKLVALITVCYALSPIDLMPDFIPVLGYLDDIILLPALIALVIKLIPKEVWQKNKEAAAGMWQDGKSKRWYFALPVIVVRLLIIGLIVKAVLSYVMR